MPRLRRLGFTRRTELTRDQRAELWLGPRADGKAALASSFPSDHARRQAWLQVRDEMMANPSGLRRPWGWWKYETTVPRRASESDDCYLERVGVATPLEVAILRHYRQRAAEGHREAAVLAAIRTGAPCHA